MDNNLYTDIGYAVVWCVKFIFIQIGVSVSARIIAEKLLRPQPENHVPETKSKQYTKFLRQPSRSARNQDRSYLRFMYEL